LRPVFSGGVVTFSQQFFRSLGCAEGTFGM
jgi:hypothetical protein